MKLSTKFHSIVLDVATSWVVQRRQSQQPPHEIFPRPHHVREVPQVPGHTENFPNLCLPSGYEPLLTQQTFNRVDLYTREPDFHGVRVDSEP